jgi:hypothetical protein
VVKASALRTDFGSVGGSWRPSAATGINVLVTRQRGRAWGQGSWNRAGYPHLLLVQVGHIGHSGEITSMEDFKYFNFNISNILFIII